MGSIKEINIKNRTYYLYQRFYIKDLLKLRFAKTRQEVIQRHCYLLQRICHKKG